MCAAEEHPDAVRGEKRDVRLPEQVVPVGAVGGAHPGTPARLCSSVGFSTDFTIDGGLRDAWYPRKERR